jgi:hypothetical protein
MNLKSYLRRKDYTFSKELAALQLGRYLGNHANLLRDRDILFLEERLRKKYSGFDSNKERIRKFR